MTKLLLVMLGGALGTGGRYGVSLLVNQLILKAEHQPAQFPWATLLINITGSFLMGLLAQWFNAYAPLETTWRLFLLTGVLGGYTTFSAFSLENLTLLRTGEIGLAFIYLSGSVAVGLLAVWCGTRLGQALT